MTSTDDEQEDQNQNVAVTASSAAAASQNTPYPMNELDNNSNKDDQTTLNNRNKEKENGMMMLDDDNLNDDIAEMEKLLAQQEENGNDDIHDDYVMLNNHAENHDNDNRNQIGRNQAAAAAGVGGANNNGHENGNDAQNNNNNEQMPADPFNLNDNDDNDDIHPQFPAQQHQPPTAIPPRTTSILKANYTTLSLTITTLHILYILRTRKQLYLALMYLTTSRISYILVGNSVISSFFAFYHAIIRNFLGGLRLIEIESIAEHVRWNITESIFAMTMFRQEVSVKMMCLFLVVFWLKCLHWAVELRGSHLRMTEEVFYFVGDDDDLVNAARNINHNSGGGGDGSNELNIMAILQEHNNTRDGNGTTTTTTTTLPNTSTSNQKSGILTTLYTVLTPPQIQSKITFFLNQCPRIRGTHFKYYLLMNLLYIFDLGLIAYCASEIIESGPSANILFLFEGTIMMITILSCYFLFGLHVFDGWITVMQQFLSEGDDHDDDGEDTDETAVQPTTPTTSQSSKRIIVGRIASLWRDNRAKANFSVELMALAAKFLLNLALFITVFATYGLPISIIRDFYVAFLRLRRRLAAFISYRKLTSDLDTRFQTITTEEELDDVGRDCIICREPLDVHGVHGIVKKLPCGHAFHQHCLREWLVQQQNCPTCRSDIKSSEARVARFGGVIEEEEEHDYNDDDIEEVAVDDESVARREGVVDRIEGQEGLVGSSVGQIRNDYDVPKAEDEEVIKTTSLYEGDKSNSTSLEFPALCKVTQNVPVANFTTKGTVENKSSTCQVITKILNKDAVVVCTEMKLWCWNEICVEMNESIDCHCIPREVGAGLFCLTPSGWVKRTELTKLLVLKRKVE